MYGFFSMPSFSDKHTDTTLPLGSKIAARKLLEGQHIFLLYFLCTYDTVWVPACPLNNNTGNGLNKYKICKAQCKIFIGVVQSQTLNYPARSRSFIKRYVPSFAHSFFERCVTSGTKTSNSRACSFDKQAPKS